MPKIIHFRDDCIGCYTCVEHAPNNWEIGEDGRVNLKRAEEKNGVFVAEIADVEIDCNLCAAHDCPVRIIRVQDDQGKEL